MKRGAPWKGFDYAQGCVVTKTRDEWRVIIGTAPRTERLGGDLCVMSHDGRIAFEIYDKDRPQLRPAFCVLDDIACPDA